MGTVTVISSDKSQPTLVLKNIKRPLEVKEMIHERVEEMKVKRRVRVGEVMGDDFADEDDFEEDNDI